ncbi:MAG: hypothetical protein ACKO7W_07030 [Elainella sp.]
MTTTVKGKDIDGKMVVLKRTQPEQLTLFQAFPELEEEHCYSNTIDLYDLMPKYVASQHKIDAIRKEGKSLEIMVRRFTHRNQEYRLEITPAKILTKDEKTKEFYPTEREQLVEEALRRIACSFENGYYLNDKAGVQFTLSQLRQELKRMGHSIHLDSLVESLKVANKVNVTLSTQDGKTLVSAPVFPVLVKTTRKEWLDNANEALCYVQFNPMVTAGIESLSYRQHNYDKFMGYRRQLTRWIHKRIYNLFTQASALETYTLKASTIIRDSGLVLDAQERNRFVAIEAALTELQEQRILHEYKAEKIRQGRKIVDVKYTLVPAGDLIRDTIFGNKRRKMQDGHLALKNAPLPTRFPL